MTALHFIVEDCAGTSCLRVEDPMGSCLAGPVPFNQGSNRLFRFGPNRTDVRLLRESLAEGVFEWKSLRNDAIESGTILFSILMEYPAVEECYRSTLRIVEKNRSENSLSTILSLRLHFEQEALRNLPWELLFDPQKGIFLSAASHISIGRGLTSEPRQPMRPPLRLLVMLATPALARWPDEPEKVELPFLDTLQLAQCLERLAQTHGEEVFSYKLLAGPSANFGALQTELGRPYDILYFIGHSHTLNGQTFFLLEDGTRLRRGHHLSDAQLGQWLTASGIRNVIFSSCDSIAGVNTISRFAELDTVIAMQMEMPIITAAAFDEAFLGSLVAWQPIEKCVVAARQQIQSLIRTRTAGLPLCEATDRPDWAIPVIFTRPSEDHTWFLEIPAGKYRLGLADEDMDQLHRQFATAGGLPRFVRDWIGEPRNVEFSAFQIGRWPVTNHQYRFFLETTSHELLPPGFQRDFSDGSVRLLNLQPTAPVVNVSRAEAEAYCCWAGARLPTADEWEAAARGPQADIFPWGNEFDRSLCSSGDRKLQQNASVLAHERGQSSFGVEDLCGNCFEWTATDEYDGNVCVVGGSRESLPIFTIPSLRCVREPDERYSDVGFRCVL